MSRRHCHNDNHTSNANITISGLQVPSLILFTFGTQAPNVPPEFPPGPSAPSCWSSGGSSGGSRPGWSGPPPEGFIGWLGKHGSAAHEHCSNGCVQTTHCLPYCRRRLQKKTRWQRPRIWLI